MLKTNGGGIDSIEDFLFMLRPSKHPELFSNLLIDACYFLPAKISSSSFIAGLRSLVSGSSVSK
jgi:hypothetical protein